MEDHHDAPEGEGDGPTQPYEIDMGDHSTSDLESAIESAMAAVDREEEPAEDEDSESRAQEDKSAAADRAVLEERVNRLESENRGLRDRLQRTLADFDNYRKRTDREKQSLKKMGIFDVVKDFLGVIDNLERAMAASGNIEDLKQGLEMILRQQQDVMRRNGVESVDAVGQPFDPTVHEAVSRSESDEVEVATVTQELQKGYLLYDRLLRPAMVQVVVPKDKPKVDPGQDAEAATTEDALDTEDGLDSDGAEVGEEGVE